VPISGELQPTPLHPAASSFEREAATQQPEGVSEKAVHAVEQGEHLQSVGSVQPRPTNDAGGDIESVEVDLGKTGVPLGNFHRGKPERVVPTEIGRGPAGGQSWVLRLQRFAGSLLRAGEDGADARRGGGEDGLWSPESQLADGRCCVRDAPPHVQVPPQHPAYNATDVATLESVDRVIRGDLLFNGDHA